MPVRIYPCAYWGGGGLVCVCEKHTCCHAVKYLFRLQNLVRIDHRIKNNFLSAVHETGEAKYVTPMAGGGGGGRGISSRPPLFLYPRVGGEKQQMFLGQMD